jgi:hypothetical protein
VTVVLLLIVALIPPLVLAVWSMVMLRGRPSGRRVAAWLVPLVVVVAAGWGAMSRADAHRYDGQCARAWAARAERPLQDASGATTLAGYLPACRAARRQMASQRRADPDASCDMEDSSACPEDDLRSPWLIVSAVIAGLGLLHVVAGGRVIRYAEL